MQVFIIEVKYFLLLAVDDLFLFFDLDPFVLFFQIDFLLHFCNQVRLIIVYHLVNCLKSGKGDGDAVWRVGLFVCTNNCTELVFKVIIYVVIT